MSRIDIKTLGIVALILSTPVAAGPRDALLTQYAAEARVATPAFGGFSAARGKTLHNQNFAGGKADTPACVSCHGNDPRAAGRTRSGKAVEAMAVSATPTRFLDAAKVEKWFRRNCNDVAGRECTPQEKADVLAWLLTLKP